MSKDTVEIEWVRKEVHDKRAVNLSIKRKETLSGSYPSIFVATIMFTQGYPNTSPAYQHEIYAGSEPSYHYQQNHMASMVEPPPNMTLYPGLNSAIQSMQQFCYPVMPTRVQQLRGLQKVPLVASTPANPGPPPPYSPPKQIQIPVQIPQSRQPIQFVQSSVQPHQYVYVPQVQTQQPQALIRPQQALVQPSQYGKSPIQHPQISRPPPYPKKAPQNKRSSPAKVITVGDTINDPFDVDELFDEVVQSFILEDQSYSKIMSHQQILDYLVSDSELPSPCEDVKPLRLPSRKNKKRVGPYHGKPGIRIENKKRTKKRK